MGGRVFGHIGSRSAVFSTQGQTLQQTQQQYQERCRRSNGRITGHQTNGKSGAPHDDQGQQKGIFPTNQVTQTAKYQRTKGTHDKTRCKSSQYRKIGSGRVASWKKFGGNDRRQCAKNVEVVPFDQSTYR